MTISLKQYKLNDYEKLSYDKRKRMKMSNTIRRTTNRQIKTYINICMNTKGGHTMKKTLILGIAAVALLLAFSPLVSTAAGEPGQKGYDFKLNDYNGNSHSLWGSDENKAVAVIWVSTRCPVSNNYNERMEKLYQKYKGKGVAFIGINSNKAEDANEVKEHAKKYGLTFPIVKDPNNVIADNYEATKTPEVYVFNKDKKLLYHGRIDDSQKVEKITTHDLTTALNEILDGKAVSNPKTKAFGCSIKRVSK